MTTGAETLHANRTKWPRELRHPNDIISNKHECMEIPHKTTQEDIGQARRARELTHATRINRIEHATLQNGYYYSVATTTGCYYYGRLLLQVAATTGGFCIVFHVGPAVGEPFCIVFYMGPRLGPT